MGVAALFGYAVRFQYGKLKYSEVPLNVRSESVRSMRSVHTEVSVRSVGGDTFDDYPDKGSFVLTVSNVYPWLLKRAKIPRSEICNFTDLYILGTGAMGTVRLSQWRYRHCRLLVAIKSVRKDYIRRYKDERHIQNEKNALMCLDKSPFIVRLFNTFQDDDSVHFILEYCPGGTLQHLLQRRRNFSDDETKFYAAEIFLALEHMHANNFTHRDLRPDNVMISENGHCKLIDFGSARLLQDEERCHTFIGSPAYMSPERLYRGGEYDDTSDWWSYGVLLFELRHGHTPFSNLATDTPNDIRRKVLANRIDFGDALLIPLVDIITGLLTVALESRLVKPADICSHLFFKFFGCAWKDFEVHKVVPPFVPRVHSQVTPYYSDGFRQDHLPRNRYVHGDPNLHDPFEGF